MTSLTADPVLLVTGFARALRLEGVPAGPARVTAALRALGLLDATDDTSLYWACRLTMCAQADDLPRFDEAFDRWFRSGLTQRPRPLSAANRAQTARLVPDSPAGTDAQETDDVLALAASPTEILRSRDVASLTEEERAEVNRMISLLAPRMRTRPTMRRRPKGRERLDARRTVRAMLGNDGEVAALLRDRRRNKPRRLVLLIDISGSMEPYADSLLRFGHAALRLAPASAEVFTAGTRLTRVTRQLRIRDAAAAARACGTAVPDWSGGTRLGETLRAFLDLWGQRGTARGAVLLIASDGWERGDAALLGEQMQRLARLAHRVVWLNPHRGKDGFAPTTAGMSAALPFIDDLIAGHSFDALQAAAEVLADA